MSANENLTRVAIAFMKITAHTFYMSVACFIPYTFRTAGAWFLVVYFSIHLPHAGAEYD